MPFRRLKLSGSNTAEMSPFTGHSPLTFCIVLVVLTDHETHLTLALSSGKISSWTTVLTFHSFVPPLDVVPQTWWCFLGVWRKSALWLKSATSTTFLSSPLAPGLAWREVLEQWRWEPGSSCRCLNNKKTLHWSNCMLDLWSPIEMLSVNYPFVMVIWITHSVHSSVWKSLLVSRNTQYRVSLSVVDTCLCRALRVAFASAWETWIRFWTSTRRTLMWRWSLAWRERPSTPTCATPASGFLSVCRIIYAVACA